MTQRPGRPPPRSLGYRPLYREIKLSERHAAPCTFLTGIFLHISLSSPYSGLREGGVKLQLYLSAYKYENEPI